MDNDPRPWQRSCTALEFCFPYSQLVPRGISLDASLVTGPDIWTGTRKPPLGNIENQEAPQWGSLLGSGGSGRNWPLGAILQGCERKPSMALAGCQSPARGASHTPTFNRGPVDLTRKAPNRFVLPWAEPFKQTGNQPLCLGWVAWKIKNELVLDPGVGKRSNQSEK